MLITTSRKPSQRTRIFCRGLERTLNARSVNRGKMSLRDVFLKAKGMEADWVLVVTERMVIPVGWRFTKMVNSSPACSLLLTWMVPVGKRRG
nr:hypothetical protein [Methanobacterium formicicum]